MSLHALSGYNDAEDEIKDMQVDEVPKKDAVPAASMKPKSLVSYVGDYSDDDDPSSDEETVPKPSAVVNLELASALSSTGSASPSGATDTETAGTATTMVKDDLVKLPPEPEGRCSKSLQEKIAKMIAKKEQGMNVNEYVQRKKEFRNPSIYNKLVSYIGIDEHGTNFPKHLFDPTVWGPESHYDNLAKLQKEHHDKKEKEKLKRTQVEFVKKTVVPTAGGGGEKKSKWDQKSEK